MDNEEGKRIVTFIIVIIIASAFIAGFGKEEGGGVTGTVIV